MDQADCWHRACSNKSWAVFSIFRFGWGYQSPRRRLDLSTPRSLQSLWPVTPLPKLELICGICYVLTGMQVSVASQAHCSMSPGDNPHFSCQAGFHSYFTGKLRVLLHLSPASYEKKQPVPACGFVCQFVVEYGSRFDSMNNKTNTRLGPGGGKYLFTCHVPFCNLEPLWNDQHSVTDPPHVLWSFQWCGLVSHIAFQKLILYVSAVHMKKNGWGVPTSSHFHYCCYNWVLILHFVSIILQWLLVCLEALITNPTLMEPFSVITVSLQTQ